MGRAQSASLLRLDNISNDQSSMRRMWAKSDPQGTREIPRFGQLTMRAQFLQMVTDEDSSNNKKEWEFPFPWSHDSEPQFYLFIFISKTRN